MKPEEKKLREYLDKKVNCILKPLIRELIKEKPIKVCDFIISFCQNEGKKLE